MSKSCRQFFTLLSQSLCAAAVCIPASGYAMVLGHSRVVSLPDQPLQMVIQLKDINAASLASLTANVAPESAWQEMGLTPPVDLSTLRAYVLPGLDTDQMQLVLRSSEIPTSKVLDLLVDISTDISVQRHQVSVLQTQQITPVVLAAETLAAQPAMAPVPKNIVLTPFVRGESIDIEPDGHTDNAGVGPESVAAFVAPKPASMSQSAKSAASSSRQTTVKKGQSSYQIARQNSHADYNDQQFMAALLQENPNAFIDSNMNLLRSGANLTIPEPQTIAAISKEQASQIYQTQLQQFDEYRQRLAQGQPLVVAAEPQPEPALSTSSEVVLADEVVEATVEESIIKDDVALEPEVVEEVKSVEADLPADRLQLSAQTDTDTKQDQDVAQAKALNYTAERLALLEQPSAELASQSTVVEPVPVPVVEPAPIVESEPVPVIESEVTTQATSILIEEPLIVSDTTKKPWWKSVSTYIWGMFLLLATLIAVWLLRLVRFHRMEYAEVVPENEAPARPRDAAQTDEAEFRELK